MSPETFVSTILNPALWQASDPIGIAISQESRVLLVAIAGQEMSWTYRLQIGAPQYGRGFWSFESAGIQAVATHTASAAKSLALADALAIPHVLDTAHEAIAWNDVFAVGMARLLLWTDPAPLPPVGDQQGGWSLYLRTWNPGTPRPADWPANYTAAVRACAPRAAPPVS